MRSASPLLRRPTTAALVSRYHAPTVGANVWARALSARAALCAPHRLGKLIFEQHRRRAGQVGHAVHACACNSEHSRIWACVGAGSARGHVCECAWARACVLGACPSAHPTVASRGEGKGCRGELCGPCAVSPSTNRCHAHSGVRARQPQRPRWQRAEPMAAAREPSKEEERQRWRETEAAPATGAGPWQLLWLPPGRGVVHSERSPDTQTAAVRSWTPLAWRRCGRVL